MKRRNTASKQQIMAMLESSGSALNHEMVQSKVKNIDRATIYRVLNRFCEDGIAHRVIGDDGKQYFALCVNCNKENHSHNHFHFRCLKCGTVECLKGEMNVSLPAGYHSESINGFVTGHCNKC